VHLTAQVSKAAERFIGRLFLPYLSTSGAKEPNQFAYTAGRGARDTVAYYVLRWILGLNSGMNVAVFCSDVSGAFDRVSVESVSSTILAGSSARGCARARPK